MSGQGMQQAQRQVQTMVLAPQMRQSLKILQVPAMELRSTILEELQSNPVLDELPMDADSIETPASAEADPEIDSGHDEASPDGPGADADPDMPAAALPESAERLEFRDDFSVLEKLHEDWQDYLREEAGEPFTSDDAERRRHFFDSVTGETSLQEHLMEQARLSESDPAVLAALEYLVGSLDDSGFLGTTLADLALQGNLSLRAVQQAAALLKTLDPPGIGAADVRECLLLQLQAAGRKDALAARIIRDHWDLLLRRRIPDIARRHGTTSEAVQEALREIAQLDPAPGRRFGEDSNRVVEADVTVEKDEYGVWQVYLNDRYIPRLRLNPDYKRMLADGSLRGKDREYIRNKFRDGRFLISAIEQRQQTVERITRELLRQQEAFFERGSAALRPLTMSQVADAVGVHETTVSRAIANKFIRTPHGVLEMKYFFTPGYRSEGGDQLSSTSVKERIARIVAAEIPARPLSDQRIAEILKEEGLEVARRTVAKYREELGILPTHLRRRYD
jgi:RNA polymerase sigma-54 factor